MGGVSVPKLLTETSCGWAPRVDFEVGTETGGDIVCAKCLRQVRVRQTTLQFNVLYILVKIKIEYQF